MPDAAAIFASDFDQRFRAQTATYSHHEIPLFHALSSALVSAGGSLYTEIYHGASHQVRFVGNGSFARTQARCELSDLLIVAYSAVTREARLTFLQAKSERARLTMGAGCGHKFEANLEQWFLLAQRPLISGVGFDFNPPADLLSNALLPSVGSFAFFYKDMNQEFQTFYAAANHLTPAWRYTQRKGRLIANSPCLMAPRGRYPERTAACDNLGFAESLFRLEIGTPLHASVPQTQSTRDWLSGVLQAQTQMSQGIDKQSDLTLELIDILESDASPQFSVSFGAADLIVIKGDVGPYRG